MPRLRKGNVGDRVILKKRMAHIGHLAIIDSYYPHFRRDRPYDQLMYTVSCSCGSNLYGLPGSGFDLEERGEDLMDQEILKDLVEDRNWLKDNLRNLVHEVERLGNQLYGFGGRSDLNSDQYSGVKKIYLELLKLSRGVDPVRLVDGAPTKPGGLLLKEKRRCDCKVEFYGPYQSDGFILYCSLHKVAPDLVEKAKEVETQIKSQGLMAHSGMGLLSIQNLRESAAKAEEN